MWNRRKEDENRPPAPLSPSSASLAREGITMNTLPTRHPDMETGRMASIGKTVVIKGQLYSREDLYVDGEVEGTIEMQEHRLTVGPNGRVNAGVKAREIVVLGTIHGNVEVGDKIEIRDVMYLSVSIDHRMNDGATGARFINHVASMLQDPQQLLLEM